MAERKMGKSSCELPLVMVNGTIADYNQMSADELETFVPFMAMCSINRECAVIEKVPLWWFSTVPFRFPIRKPRELSIKEYVESLRRIVATCYQYHESKFLLDFCVQVASHPDSVVLRENTDGTTSVYGSKSMLHIMNFSNENKVYDSKPKSTARQPQRLQRRVLMPTKTRNVSDVFLCDNCDLEFTCEADIISHERICRGEGESERIIPVEPSIPYEILPSVNLVPKNYTIAPGPSLKPTLKKTLLSNFQLEFSSPLGRLVLSQNSPRDITTRPLKTVQTYEAFCTLTARSSKRENIHEFRGFSQRSSYRGDKYGRPYCFSARERRERYLTLTTGLSERSRNLLDTKCGVCEVKLARIQIPEKTEDALSFEAETDEDVDIIEVVEVNDRVEINEDVKINDRVEMNEVVQINDRVGLNEVVEVNEDVEMKDDFQINEDAKKKKVVEMNEDVEMKDDIQMNEDVTKKKFVEMSEDLEMKDDIQTNEDVTKKKVVEMSEDLEIIEDTNPVQDSGVEVIDLCSSDDE